MHLLEIGATQPAFGKHLSIHSTQIPFHDKGLSKSFVFGNEKRTFSAWKAFGIGRNLSFHFRGGGTFLVKAVATTLEPKQRLVRKNGNKKQGPSDSELVIEQSSPPAQIQYNDEDSEKVDEREKLRRTRISKANTGNTPWNKGKKHSPETIQRIRERTRIAMQNPKVKRKLANLGHAQTEETKKKIAVGVRNGWRRRQRMLRIQENCLFDWQNLIAEASREGFDGQAELQWDSYTVLSEKLQEEWLESIERRKAAPRLQGSKRAPKSPEQRRKISEAISRKWADTDYRERVVSALNRYHGIEPGGERKTRKRPSGDSATQRKSPVRKSASNVNEYSRIVKNKPKSRKRNAPSYKDPLASSKLEMIKNIRARRASVDTKKTEAVERAKLLIAEAEKAAKALEVAAEKSPIARASLIETRKLIAEAIRSIQSIETEKSSEGSTLPQDEISDNPEDLPVESDNELPVEIPTETSPIKVNGTRTQTITPSSKEESFGFSDGNSNSQDEINSDNALYPVVNSLTLLSSATEIGKSSRLDQDEVDRDGGGDEQEKPLVNGSEDVEANVAEQALPVKASAATTITKKWVRGRLVEVGEGAV